MASYNNSSNIPKGIPATAATAHYGASGFDQNEYKKLIEYLNNFYTKCAYYDTKVGDSIYKIINDNNGWHTTAASSWVTKELWAKLDEALKKVFGNCTSIFGRVNQAVGVYAQATGMKITYGKWNHVCKHSGSYGGKVADSINGKAFVNTNLADAIEKARKSTLAAYDNEMNASVTVIAKCCAFMNDTVIANSIVKQMQNIAADYKARLDAVYKSAITGVNNDSSRIAAANKKAKSFIGGSSSKNPNVAI